MNALFATKEGVTKTYWAVVDKLPPEEEGQLTNYMIRDIKRNKSIAYVDKKPHTKEARLNYKVLGASKTFFLIEIVLETGRHHQIRAQLATIGLHIKGDLKYGFPRSDPNGGIHLHARKLEFIHPVSKEKITVIARPPQDPVWDYFSTNY